MAGTKIVDAVTTLLHSTATGAEFVAIGKVGSTDSIKMSLTELQSWLTITLDKIEEGNSSVEVVDPDGITPGYVAITIDGVEMYRIVSTAIQPKTTNTLDVGTSTYKIKDIHMAGGIELGSDATGDVYYRDSSGNLEKLAAGTAGHVLTQGASIPAWTAIPITSPLTNKGDIYIYDTADDRLEIGNEGELLTVGSSGLPEWIPYSTEYVPNYFIQGGTDYGASAIAAFDELDAYLNNGAGTPGTVGSTGANIYIEGFVQLDRNASWNMTNVRLYGNNCYLVVNDTNTNVSNYTITIVGSPTFDNIQFAGSLGLTSINFSTFYNKEFMIVTNTNADGEDLTFRNCLFADIVGGTTGGPPMEACITYTNLPANSGSFITFENCKVTSHNAAGMFTYNGFTINVAASAGGSLRVSSIDQQFIASTTDNEANGFNSMNYYIIDTPTGSSIYFDSDYSSQLVSASDGTRYNITDKTIVIPALADADKLIIEDDGTGNVHYITLGALKTYINTP